MPQDGRFARTSSERFGNVSLSIPIKFYGKLLYWTWWTQLVYSFKCRCTEETANFSNCLLKWQGPDPYSALISSFSCLSIKLFIVLITSQMSPLKILLILFTKMLWFNTVIVKETAYTCISYGTVNSTFFEQSWSLFTKPIIKSRGMIFPTFFDWIQSFMQVICIFWIGNSILFNTSIISPINITKDCCSTILGSV